MSRAEYKLWKLIKLGRKPRGIKEADIVIKENAIYLEGDGIFSVTYSLNDLCSIDSGLRDFVVEKSLYDSFNYGVVRSGSNYDDLKEYITSDLEYRLMMSSIAEGKEEFLLDNIIIDD